MPSAQELARQLQQLSAEGICIRPRALTNTLFLRLFLSDLFIHGIGGGKYDQITDLIGEDLYGVRLPAYAVFSQTTLLPVTAPFVRQGEITEKRTQLRRMFFHPERFISLESFEDQKLHQVSSWMRRKRDAVQWDPPPPQRRQRHRQIVAANAKLRQFLLKKPEEFERSLAALERTAAMRLPWRSREWAYVLFPTAFLQRRLLDLRFAAS